MAQAVQDLLLWQRAIELSVCVYELTRSFPQDELYGLTSQLRRATISIASNIAGGRGRLTQGEFRHFLGVAQGSNYEVETQLIVARRLQFGKTEMLDRAEALSGEVGRMLSSLLSIVAAKRSNG